MENGVTQESTQYQLRRVDIYLCFDGQINDISNSNADTLEEDNLFL